MTTGMKNAKAKNVPQKGPGRPTMYAREIVDEICQRIAAGEPLSKICLSPNIPAYPTIQLWLRNGKHPEFVTAYARAREDQADTLADEIVRLADESVGGDSAAVQAARLRVDARKWIASKLRPQRYSERLEHSHGGEVVVKLIPGDADL